MVEKKISKKNSKFFFQIRLQKSKCTLKSFVETTFFIFSCNKIWHFLINNFSVWKKLNFKIWSKIHTWLMPIKVRCSVLPVRSSVLKYKSHVRNVRSSVCQCSKCSMFGILVFDPPLVHIQFVICKVCISEILFLSPKKIECNSTTQ